MNSIASLGESDRLFGARAKFWTGHWKSTAVASSNATVVPRSCRIALSRLMCAFRNVPPYSMDARLLRTNGWREALTPAVLQKCGLKNRFSLARTASAPAKFGYILSQPRGIVQP